MPKSQQDFELAVETSGRIGSIALGKDGILLQESEFSGVMKHSVELFDVMTALLEQANAHPAQVGTVYITAGPGSFTGIRIAVTFAKMMGYALNSRIVAVDTLDAMTANADDFSRQAGTMPRRIAPILDAKQNRFFTALYEHRDGEWVKIHPSALLYPEELLALINKDNIPTALLGEGLVYYADKFKNPLTTLLEPSFWTANARGVYTVGLKMAEKHLYSDINTLIPTYIRKPDAIEKRGL